MIRPSVVLAILLVSIQLRSAWAEDGGADGTVAALSCFQPPDYCLRNFAKAHDRDYYELCMLSERICRDYRSNWKLVRTRVRENGILNDCFPVVSVDDLLKLCRSPLSRDRAGCRQNIAELTSGADLRCKSGHSQSGGDPVVACSKTGAISHTEYLKAFVVWAEKHPLQRHLSAREGISAAAAAWRSSAAKVRRTRSHN